VNQLWFGTEWLLWCSPCLYRILPSLRRADLGRDGVYRAVEGDHGVSSKAGARPGMWQGGCICCGALTSRRWTDGELRVLPLDLPASVFSGQSRSAAAARGGGGGQQ
jgi:hypothetical protein